MAVGAFVPSLPRSIGAQDLRYNVTPTAQQVSWDNALGLDNTLLYGGRLGVVFGRRIELQGFYLTNQGTDTGIRDLYARLDVGTAPPQNPGLQVRNFGSALVYNFSVGAFTPFVRAGGSVLRFDPAGGERSDRVALSYGGGLRFGKPGGLRFNVFAEDLRFRVDRTLLLALPVGAAPPVGGTPVDPDANKLRSNLTYGAGLSIPLGGGAVTYDDTPQYQLSNVAIPVDVFAGRFDFAGSSGVPRQNLAGVRTGIDFGPLVGLRAFYFQGVNDNFNRTQGVRGYGGEAQFALNAGPGFNPFLLAGAGQIDFTDRYDRVAPGVGGALVRPQDQTALILGGGVKVPLGTRFTLSAAARNWLAASGGRTENVAVTSELRSNWQYTAGLSFGIGGRGARRRTVSAPVRDTVFVDRVSGRRLGAREREAAGEVMETRDAVVDRFVVTSRGDTLRGSRADSALVEDRDARLVQISRGGGAGSGARGGMGGVTRIDAEGARGGFQSDRTVEIVVPTQGEIIVRYGPPAPAAAPVMVGVPGGMPFVQGAPAAPARNLVREFRDPQGRIVREYREPDNRLVREYENGGRTVREYRDANGRVRREYVPVPVPAPVGPTGYAPQVIYPGAAPTYQGAPQVIYPPQPGVAAVAPTAVAPTAPAPAGGTVQSSSAGTVAGDPPLVVEGPSVRKSAAGEDVALPGTPAEPAAPAQDVPPAQVAAAPAGASAEEVRAMIREELARSDAARAAAQPAAAQPVIVLPGQPAAAPAPVIVQPPQPVYVASSGVQGFMLYSGGTVSTGNQALAGGRIDFGALSQRLPGFRLVPELAFGFGGGGTSTYIATNAQYEFGPFFRVMPRFSLGAGLLNFSNPVGGRNGLSVVVTPSYGVSIPLSGFRPFGTRVPELVVEHQGPALYDVQRLVVGLGWRR